MAALVAALSTGVVAVGPAQAQAGTGGFITRSGTQFLIDGAPFQFTGINIYNAQSDGWCGPPMRFGSTLDDALSSIGPGKKILRTWFFQGSAIDWDTSQRDWSAFDHTLEVADAHGMKVIATLTDEWGECGTHTSDPANGIKYEPWYLDGYKGIQPGMLASYRDWVAEAVDRYKDDARVAFWQLSNEAEIRPVDENGVPIPCPTGDAPADTLKAWADDVSSLVKSIDPNHLVSLGTIGNGNCGAQSGQYQTIHDLPGIDMCEYHDYGSPSVGIPGDQWNGLQVRIDQCNALDKPIFVGEAGMTPDDVGGFQERADAFAAKMKAQFDAGVRGFLAWAWSPPSLPSTMDSLDIGVNDPTLSALARPTLDDSLSTGRTHTCAQTDVHGLKCWGQNFGRLGFAWPSPKSDIPRDAIGLSGPLRSVAGGGNHTCSLTVTGGVQCYGEGYLGQLGGGWDGTAVEPVDVVGLSSGVAQVATGYQHTCALTLERVVKCWGHGLTENSNVPVDVAGLPPVVSISAGYDFTCAVTAAGAVMCWGVNDYHQLGDGSTTSRSTPAVVSGLTSGWAWVSAGWNHACALSTWGAVRCWGWNGYGQLGNGTFNNGSTSVAVSGLSSGVASISAGYEHTCALMDTGAAKCWGQNSEGQVGDDTALGPRLTPQPVLGLSAGVAELHAGGYHTCARMDDESLKCWGWNNYGQLGNNGTTTHSTAPGDVLFDGVAPDPPTNVSASPGNGEATVSWSTPEDDGGSAISGYVITTFPGGATTSVGVVNSATVTGLTNGSSYTFTVSAVNSAIGQGNPSSPSAAVTPRTVPNPPANVVAAAGNASATVSWTPPLINGGAAISGYVVTTVQTGAKKTVGTVTNTTITGLTNGSTYTFTVKAKNVAGAGNASAPSNAVTPQAAKPGAPTTPTAVAGNAEATVSWSPPTSDGGSPITSYSVTSTPGGLTANVIAPATTAAVTGLTNGVSYRFSVVATNAVGTSPASPLSLAVVPTGAPSLPTGVGATAIARAALVTWTAPATNGGSAITAYTVSSSGGQTITVDGALRGAVVSGLTNGVSYTFTVVATNAVGTSPASAATLGITPAASQRPIAFGSNRTGTYDIFVMDPAGVRSVQLMNAPDIQTDPSISPNGNRIAYTTGTGNGQEVVVMNLDGRNQTQLTTNAVTDAQAVWSGDGSQIAFMSTRDGNAEIYRMNTNGTSPVRLTTHTANDSFPSWSSDGTKIAFTSFRDGDAEVWTMNAADGSGLAQITQQAGADNLPAWSPNGTQIAFTSARDGNPEIYVMNADGSVPARMTTHTATDQAPQWSPDGTRLVWASNRVASTNFEIYTRTLVVATATRLTFSSTYDLAPDW